MIIYDAFVKIGCTTLRSDGDKTEAQKAKHFADQWQRSNYGEELQFYMVDVAAPMKEGCGTFTKFSWESEAFRQIKEMLQEQEGGHIVSSQNSNDNICEEIEEMQSSLKNGAFKGKFYRQPKNSTRTETRPLFKTNQQGYDDYVEEQPFQLNDNSSIAKTYILEYINILDGICHQSQSTYLAHRRYMREYWASLPQGIHDNEVCKFYEKNWENCYADGQSQYGTANSDYQTGGGSLPLSPFSTYSLFFAFIKALPSSKEGKLTIYWIGCGWGEEICLIALLAKQFDFPLHITATEYDECYIPTVNAKISRLGLTDFITVKKEDLYRVVAIPDTYDIIYTSACPLPCFSLKLLYLSLKSARAQYLLWNREHNDHVISSDDHADTPFKKLIDAKVKIVNSFLERDHIEQEKEDRTVYAIKLGTHDTRTASMLAYLKDDMLSKEFYDMFKSHFGERNSPKESSTNFSRMKQLISGKLDDNDITVDLGPLLYHKLDHGESEITVTKTIRADYSARYHESTSDKNRNAMFKEFWGTHIYSKALQIWERQEVLPVLQDGSAGEQDVNSHFTSQDMLTFQPMQTKKQMNSRKRPRKDNHN